MRLWLRPGYPHFHGCSSDCASEAGVYRELCDSCLMLRTNLKPSIMGAGLNTR